MISFRKVYYYKLGECSKAKWIAKVLKNDTCSKGKIFFLLQLNDIIKWEKNKSEEMEYSHRLLCLKKFIKIYKNHISRSTIKQTDSMY